MRILAIDIGTGTQDILLFDTSLDVPNCPKMVMPSPTATVARRIGEATARGEAILFTGFTMGGGPSKWALRQHLEAGCKAYATMEAARTFDDDMAEVEKMGVVLVSPDEARTVRYTNTIELKDIHLGSIATALSAMGVDAEYNVIAVAVQDHGAAPQGTSDRIFRFQHMAQRLEKRNDLLAFSFLVEEVPDYLTRMAGVAKSLANERLVLLMDTGFAAILGADEDPAVSRHRDRVIVNLGNSHTIAFHMHGQAVQGMVEHHTHSLDREALENLLAALSDGSLTNQDVFESGGHGAVVLRANARRHFIAAVGPQRDRLSGSALRPYFAVPHGDMMIAGCFGLVRACADRFPNWSQEIESALSGQ
ncbi:MAG: DUF1786 family protein [Dehalococcoidia bacterium]|nr:DUF1786 family protein [Dehalococcoidia bacterium]